MAEEDDHAEREIPLKKSPTAATLVGLLAVSLALSSCAETDPETEGSGAHDEHSAETADNEYNEADLEYVSGMIVHHQQAVEMADILLEKDDTDSDVAALAEDIRAAQQPEIDRMESWLQSWGHESDEDGDHGDHGDAHEGMMSEQDLEDLEAADGEEVSRLFLEQMILHHEGAVSMAEEHLESGENPDALELSENVIVDQGAEIEEMEEMLGSL